MQSSIKPIVFVIKGIKLYFLVMKKIKIKKLCLILNPKAGSKDHEAVLKSVHMRPLEIDNMYLLGKSNSLLIPFLQLKIGYYLSNMNQPGQGNLCVVPGSHKAQYKPVPEDLIQTDLFPGAIEICAPPGTAILFHNALWHSHGPWRHSHGPRIMLYYAYEHPWMIASQEHWGYTKAFYNRLSPERHTLFHGFLFEPPEHRWQ